jgi:hypothetical protein
VNQFFSAEGENECTSEKVRGQFSIFGAVEENHRCKVSRIKRIEELGDDIWLRRVEGGPSIEGDVRREGSQAVGGPIVHRDCTGNAERQGGDWRSILSSRLPVRGRTMQADANSGGASLMAPQ